MNVKQIKTILGNYRTYIVQIKNIDLQLSGLVCNDTVMSSEKDFPYSSQLVTITGCDMRNLVDSGKLRRQQHEYVKGVKFIKDFVNQISDPITKAIFERYYLMGDKTTWKCISLDFGWHDEQCARVKHNRYLAELVKSGVLDDDNPKPDTAA